MTVFVDTFALIAWLNPDDQAHHDVVEYLGRFSGQLVTTEWVLVELADALCAPEARTEVVSFLGHVRADPAFEIVGFRPEVYSAGLELYGSRPDKSWSLTDCISFVVMSQRGLSQALTADRHFEQAGFQAVFRN